MIVDLKAIQCVVERLVAGYKPEEIADVFGAEALAAGQKYLQDNPQAAEKHDESETVDPAVLQEQQHEIAQLRQRCGELDAENNDLKDQLQQANDALTNAQGEIKALEARLRDDPDDAPPAKPRGRPRKNAAA